MKLARSKERVRASGGGRDKYPMGEALDFLGGMWRLNHAIEKLSSRMERTVGVTAQQRFIVRSVGTYPGITAGHLAKLLHLDPGTVSATLGRLEEKALVTRRRDERDRRRVTIGLTSLGMRLADPTAGTVEHAVGRLLQTSHPEDVARAYSLLGELTRLLDLEDGTKREEPGPGVQLRTRSRAFVVAGSAGPAQGARARGGASSSSSNTPFVHPKPI